MKHTLKFVRTAMVATALAAVPAVAQDAAGTGAGSGSGSATGAGQEMSRTSPIEVEHDNDGFDLGWMGLLGLAGLAGLRRKPTVTRDHTVHHTTDRI